MLSLRTTSPFDLFDRLDQQLHQQLNQQLHGSERFPAAEVHETPEAYEIVVELPGVERGGIDVKATDRSLTISAERRCSRALSAPEGAEAGAAPAGTPLLSEFRYGTWSRSFRFPSGINRDQLEASYRDGLLSVKAPKAQKVSTVSVRVEG